jgi:hypothetical protein
MPEHVERTILIEGLAPFSLSEVKILIMAFFVFLPSSPLVPII